jgi:hypothetical protein
MEVFMLRVALLVAVLLALAAPGAAQIPPTIFHQGFYGDSLGNAKPDGIYSFTFRLYDSASGGLLLWTEGKDLQVTAGLFHTQLGDVNAFAPGLDFTTPYWLTIQPGLDPELEPRIPLSSAPYALVAATVPDSAIGTAKIADSAVTFGKLNQSGAATGQVPFWDGAGWVPVMTLPAVYYAALPDSSLPAAEEPAWQIVQVTTPGFGVLTVTATITVHLQNEAGCPCDFRGAMYLTDFGYMVGRATDVTLFDLDQKVGLSMTGAMTVFEPGVYNIEMRLFRTSGGGAASARGYGNMTMMWTPVTEFLSTQPIAPGAAAPGAAVPRSGTEMRDR